VPDTAPEYALSPATFVALTAQLAVKPFGKPSTTLGLDPQPFVLAVLFGCNLCYATPMGYQTNLLVMSAAGYKFSDFVRAGLPLLILMWVTLSGLLAMQYPLSVTP